jgi:carboxyl-terminal processing protease
MRSSRFIVLLALAGACAAPAPTTGGKHPSAPPGVAGPSDDLAELPPDPREELLAEITTVLLTNKHLQRRPIDDALSKAAFPKYIEQLDGSKLLLLDSHVAALAKYADRMDDQLREKNLVLARKGAALVAERRKVASRIVSEITAQRFDFTVAEEIETDPKKLAHSRSEAELVDRWRRLLKLQALERIQQMEELAEGKSKPDPEAQDKEPDPAIEKLKAEIPPTFDGREAKARQEIATRYETRFARLSSMDSLEPAQLFLNAIAAVYDPHTQYLAPADKENFDIELSGRLEGIGAVLGEQDHYVVVRELVPGGASWKQGKLEPGDLILAVAQQGAAPIDVTDMPIDKVVKLIRGPKGTQVTLTVKKADGTIVTIAITRDVVHVEATYARGALLIPPAKSESVGYVYLPGFYGGVGSSRRSGERNATDDVRALLAGYEQKKLRSVIVDLRGNGGGLLEHARDISGLFVPRGPVVQTRDFTGKIAVLSDTDPSVAFSGNVVVLVDRFSASAAEILAAALQDYQRAVVVGTASTHGKGTVQAVVELDRLLEQPGSASLGMFKLTVEQYFRVTGGSVQWKGVTPDILLPDPSSLVESGERSLPNSIPWTSVGALPYERQPHRWDAATLAARSRERVSQQPLLTKVDAFAKLARARRAETREPLEQKAWRAKKKREREALEAADPALSKQKPLFELVPLPDASAPPAPPDKKVRQKLDAWKDELVRDPWVAESLGVLADMGK